MLQQHKSTSLFLSLLSLLHLFLITGNQRVLAAQKELTDEQENVATTEDIIYNDDDDDNDLPQLTLSQYMVSVDYASHEWYEDKRMPHNEWRESITGVVPFYHNWDGNLVNLHTACPESLSASNFPGLNNLSSFPEQLLDDDYEANGILRRVALVSQGDGCSWSTKVSHAHSIMDSYNMTLAGIILYEKNSAGAKNDGSDRDNIQNWPENDLADVGRATTTTTSSSTIVPVIFVNETIGTLLLRTLQYASSSMTTLSKVLVFYEKLPISPNNNDVDEEKKDELVEQQESTDRLILAGQLIVNSVAITVVILLIAYACHRFRRRQQQLAARRMAMMNSEQQPPTDNNSEDMSVIDSTTSSFLAIMRRRHGSVEEQQQDDENAGIGWQQLNTFPKMNYDPLIIRNSTCAICLDDFRVYKPDIKSTATSDTIEKGSSHSATKLVRLLKCGHGFCVSCIDPWLSSKSRNCPLCKQDCSTHDFVGATTAPTTKPEVAHTSTLQADNRSSHYSPSRRTSSRRTRRTSRPSSSLATEDN